jgi:Cys-tRNA(Pro)/Cys-tRNA(Cys) deacylase
MGDQRRNMTRKTHAMRVLDARGVAYIVREYDVSGAFHSADEAADLLGVPRESVYKTLVVLREATPRLRPLLVMIPAAHELDLKALARIAGEKKLRMATHREAEQMTGMQVGGISALALQKPGFVVLIDAAAGSLGMIHVSAGARGVDLELAVADLSNLTGAVLEAGISHPA